MPDRFAKYGEPGIFYSCYKKKRIIKKKVHVPVAGKKIIYDSS